MGVLATALANLAAVSVSGVTSYAVNETPGALARAQLPALVILPELGDDSPGLEPSGFSAGAGRLVMQVAHVLLVAPVAGGLGLQGALPALVDAVDAYVEALAGDPTLDGALPVALRLSVRTGVVRYAGVDYHGATFVHTWTLHVA
ncbi:MAG: hypothetical protein JW910_01615 [Anaerolineae bacterium]|nr:hypothetical protein [Anaerolineae bacterium]